MKALASADVVALADIADDLETTWTEYVDEVVGDAATEAVAALRHLVTRIRSDRDLTAAEQRLDQLARTITAARLALLDEHEGNFLDALTQLADLSDTLRTWVATW